MNPVTPALLVPTETEVPLDPPAHQELRETLDVMEKQDLTVSLDPGAPTAPPECPVCQDTKVTAGSTDSPANVETRARLEKWERLETQDPQVQ